jgi:hypothetical protein
MTKDLELKLKISADGKVAVEQLGRVEGAVDDVGQEADQTATLLAGMGKALAGLAGVETLRSFATALASAGIAAQDMRSKLEFAAGGAAEADRQMAILTETAAANGQGVAAMVDAYVRLKNLGLDPSRQAMEAYLNVSAASGKSLEQFVEAVADAATGEFERLKEFGIKASVEGDKVALRFRGATRLIQNDARSIEEALQEIGRKDFAGAVAAQSQNASVALNTMGDAVERLAAKMAADAELPQGIAGLANGVTALANALAKESDPDSLAASVGSVWDVLQLISNPIAALTGNLGNAGKAAGSVVGNLGQLVDAAKTGTVTLRDWSDEALAAADAADKLARSTTAQADAMQWQAEAMRGVTTALGQQSVARKDSLDAAAAYAKAIGDETAALSAQASAAAEVAEAKRLAAQSAAQDMEAAKRDLALMEQTGKAQTDQARKLRELIPQLQQKAIATAQATEASRAEVLAAQLAAATYGDQSAQLQTLIAARDRLTAAIRREGEASAALIPLQQALAVIQVQIADAANDADADIERQIQANQRALTIDQARLALQSDETTRLAALATARGDAAKASEYARDIIRDEAKALELASEAKARDAALLQERARLLEIAGKATGGYTAEERAMVEAMRDSATMAEIESERMAIGAKAKRDAARAGAELAERNRRLAESFRDAGLTGVQAMDDVRAAVARAASGPELEALRDGLEAAIQAGVDKAGELSAALEEVQAKMDGLDRNKRTAFTSFEQVYQQYGTDIGRYENSAFQGLGPNSRSVVEKEIAAYIAWLKAEKGYGRQPVNVSVQLDGYEVARATQPYLNQLSARRA